MQFYIFFHRFHPDNTIHIGIIMKNIAKPGEKSQKLLMQYVTMVRSLLKNLSSSSKRTFHFVLLTDKPSVPYLEAIMKKFILKDARNLTVWFQMFDLDVIVNKFNQEIFNVRKHFVSYSKQARKYADHLFMIAPFYHRIFPYDKMILLDADLKVQLYK